jgi:hypothetical protein
MNKHQNKHEEEKKAAPQTISPQTYQQIIEAAARLGVAVRMFPSDVLLMCVRSIAKTCEENEAKGLEHEDKQTAVICAETAEKRALLEEIGVGLTAARIRIENAMQQYAEAAAAMTGEKAEKSGLLVPKNAGKIVLTDSE